MNRSNLAGLLTATTLVSFAALPAQAQKPVEEIAGPTSGRVLAPPSPGTGTCIVGPTNLCIPLDDSFTVVDFDNGVGPCELNDDGSSTIAVPLQFAFDFFGTPETEVFINTNGNLSFGQGFSTFSPSGFPVSGFPMVAPFWGDVDTRSGPGTVFFKSEPNRFTVIWDHVAYYNQNTDLLNTFQVIITDGTDPLVGIGNNICFCYDDMQWTTGDASNGSGGFGGFPATVGANKGDGVEFFQIGRFDHPGTDFDGPGGNADGVSFLDNSTFCFNASTDNAPPVITDAPGGPLVLKAGDSVSFDVTAIAPELGQTTTLMVDAGGLANFVANVTGGGPGTPVTAACTFDPVGGQEGPHVVTFTATDDGTPVGVTMVQVMLEVTPGGIVCAGVGCPCPGPNDDPAAGCANSTGAGALLTATGSASAAADDLVLQITGLPANRIGTIIVGDTALCAPLGAGLRAATGNTLRLGGHQRTGAGGTMLLGPGIVSSTAGSIMAGTTWTFQAWYRDPSGSPCDFHNLSNGYCVSFTP